MTIDREALREKVARAICRAEYDDPDEEVIGGQAQAFHNYGPRWRAASNGCLGQTDYLAMADAALSALDQPAQEPVAWMYTNPNFPPGRPPNEVVFYRYENIGDNWTETPLYAAPQPATLPDDLSVAISQLRALCNDKIRKINQGRGVRTEGFRDINDLLKACDKVFATLTDESR